MQDLVHTLVSRSSFAPTGQYHKYFRVDGSVALVHALRGGFSPGNYAGSFNVCTDLVSLLGSSSIPHTNNSIGNTIFVEYRM